MGARLRRGMKWTVRIVIALVLVIALAWWFRVPLFGGIVRDAIAGVLGDELGGRWHVEAVDGDWWRTFEVRGIASETDPDGLLAHVAIERAHVAFNLATLLGDTPLDGITSVAIEGLDVRLAPDPRESTPAPDDPAGATDPAEILKALPSRFPVLRVDGRVRYDDGIRSGTAALTVAGDGDTIRVALVELDGQGLPMPELPPRLEITTTRPSRDTVRLAISPGTDILGLDELTLTAPDAWQLDASGRLLAGRGTVHVDAAGATWSITGVEPAQLPRWFRDLILPGLPSWLEGGAIDTGGRAEWRGDAAPLVRWHVDARGLTWAPWGRADLALRGGVLDDQRLVADEVTVRHDLGQLQVRDVEVSLDDPIASARSGSITAEVPDLARLLDRLAVTGVPLPSSPVVVDVEMSRTGAPVIIKSVRATTGATRIELTGTLEPPANATAWLDTSLDVTLTARLESALVADLDLGLDTELPVLRGTIDVAARASGTLRRPLASGAVNGDGLAVGERILNRVGVTADWTEERLALTELVVSGEGIDVTARGAWRPEHGELVDTVVHVAAPDLGVVNHLVPDAPPLSGSLTVDATVAGRIASDAPDLTARATIAGRGVTVDGRDVGRITADVDVNGPLLVVRSLELDGALARADLTGRVDLTEKTAEDVVFALDVPSLAALAATLPGEIAITGSLAANGRGVKLSADPTAMRSVAIDTQGRGLTWNGAALGDLTLRASGDAAKLALDELLLDGPHGRVRARGTFDAEARTGELALLHIEDADLGALSRALPDPPPIAGHLDVRGDARFSADDWTGTELTAHMEGRQLVWDDTVIGALEADLALRDGRANLGPAAARGAWGEATVQGEATLDGDAVNVRVLALDVRAQDRVVTLGGPLAIELRDDTVEVRDLDLSTTGGRVVGGATWSGTNETLIADLDVDVDLAALGVPVEGRVAGRIRSRGSLVQPEFVVELDTAAVAWRGLSTSLDLEIEQDATGLVVRRLELGGDAVTATGGGRLPIAVGSRGLVLNQPQTSDFSLVLSTPSLGWTERFGLPTRLEGRDLAVTVTVQDRELALEVTGAELAWNTERSRFAGSMAIEARAGDDGLTAKATAVAPDLAEMAAEVRSAGAFAWWSPPPMDDLLGRSIEGRIRVDAPDLSRLRSLSDAIAYASGEASVDLAITGSASAPQLDGLVAADHVAVRLRGDTPTFDRGTARIRFDDRRVIIEQLETRVGYAPLRVTGEADLSDHLAPAIDFRVTGENVMLVRSPGVRVRADLDITAKGPWESIEVAGLVKVTDALISRPATAATGGGPSSSERGLVLFSFREPPLSTLRLDVRVVANETIRVRNEFVRARLSSSLVLRGTGQVPRPEGQIGVRNAIVSLPFSRIVVDRGEVRFTKADPFEPQIEARAHTELRGYYLDMRARGTLNDLEPVISSRPSLSEEDAYFLLTTGATPTGLEGEGLAGATVSRAATILGKSLVGADDQEEGIAEKLAIDVGREVSESGRHTVEVEYRLTDRWSIRAEQDRFDAYNLGLVWRILFR